MGRIRLIAILLIVLPVASWGSCSKKLPPPKTAATLDVNRYMGLWHEIARLPFPFTDDCFGVSAKYEPLEDGKFLVTNYCWYKSFFGPMRRARAEAWVNDPAEPSKLKLSFFWPVALDYWVIYIDEDYETALVGTPDREYLWVMSRSFNISDATYGKLVDIARSQGYDVTRLRHTPQNTEKSLPPEDTEDNESTADGGAPDEGAIPDTASEPSAGDSPHE